MVNIGVGISRENNFLTLLTKPVRPKLFNMTSIRVRIVLSGKIYKTC